MECLGSSGKDMPTTHLDSSQVQCQGPKLHLVFQLFFSFSHPNDVHLVFEETEPLATAKTCLENVVSETCPWSL